MVKRRDKTGRRQILQLHDERQSTNVRPSLRGLSQYSDSDEEDRQAQGDNEQSVTSASEVNPVNSSRKIDVQVADFLKEIDALTAEEHETSEAEAKEVSQSTPPQGEKCNPPEEAKSEPVARKENEKNTAGKSSAAKSSASNESVQSSETYGAYTVWQHCQDESTGYTYFWNVQTNEVTWECPPEYAAYFQASQTTKGNDQKASSANQSLLNKHQNLPKEPKSLKKSSNSEEGKIIPISYFGPSSSSEDSSDDDDNKDKDSKTKVIHPQSLPLNKLKQDSRISNSNRGASTSKSILTQSNSTKAPLLKSSHLQYHVSNSTKNLSSKSHPQPQFGPQLPPDFSFSDDDTKHTTVASSDSKMPNSSEENVMFGPQLPSYYIPRDNRVKECSPASNEPLPADSNENSISQITEVETNAKCESQTLSPSQNNSCTESELPQNLGKKCEPISGIQDEEEPDSTTKKEGGTSDSMTSRITKHHDVVLQNMKTIVHYDESSEEEEVPETRTANKRSFIDNMFSSSQSGFGCGFGFNKNSQLSKEDITCDSTVKKRKTDKNGSHYPMISFVKSNEVLNLNKLNEHELNEREREERHSAGEDLDIDEIDRALDMALEKKSSEDKTLSMPSTSKQDLHKEPEEAVEKKGNEEEKPLAECTSDLYEIQDLASIVINKLAFLEAGQSNMSSLATMLIQLETRRTDWQEGALENDYFLSRIQDAHSFLQQYELSAMPPGWTCLWDRENKRYFYLNERTRQSQWEFPAEAMAVSIKSQESQSWPTSLNIDSRLSNTHPIHPQVSGPQHPLVSSSIPEEQSHRSKNSATVVLKPKSVDDSWGTGHEASVSWLNGPPVPSHSPSPSPPPPPPGVDSPPPPPLPKSPPPLPPDSTELEDGEIADVEMDIDDSSNSESSACTKGNSPSSNILQGSASSTEFKPDSLPHASPDHTTKGSSSVVSSTSTGASKLSAVITKPPQPAIPSACDLNPPLHSVGWNHSSTSYVPTHSVPNYSLTTATPGTSSESGFSKEASTSGTSGVSEASQPKKEKKKTKLSPGLALKKKNIPSLVQKWQKIKKQQQKEDNSDSEGKISTSM